MESGLTVTLFVGVLIVMDNRPHLAISHPK